MNKATIRQILRTLARLLFRVQVEGDLTALQQDRLLIVANHESFLDGILLGLFLPVDPVFVVHTTIAQNPLFRHVLSLSDYLTVDPASPMAIKKVLHVGLLPLRAYGAT